MKWNNSITEAYQETVTGTARAHSKYYIYKVRVGIWRAGRYAFGEDVDFRMQFTSARVARLYLADYDKKALIITAVTV
jgi:hypothetical protein